MIAEIESFGASQTASSSKFDGLCSLIVDMQPRHLSFLHRDARRVIIDAHLEAISHLKRLKIPVFVLEYAGYGVTDQRIRKALADHPVKVEYLPKCENSGFTNPNLKPKLDLLGVKNILISGIYVAYCVWETADDALKEGFKISTARELLEIDEETCRTEIGSHQWFKDNGTYVYDYRQLFVS